ncbi:MAG TPA: GNAT family N-acetyltransferase [Thermoanaerobaculia bacterium]|nr:GNAT family N-acetyltransferase [Thermoanaerobaculia bacterium]
MLISTAEELEGLEAEWLALWRRSSEATPFQSPMWLLPWWRAFGSDELSTIVARNASGELTALLPLYVVRDENDSLGMFLGTGNSDYLDSVGNGDAAPLLAELAERDCAMWDLQQLRPTSALLTAPLPSGLHDAVLEQDRCPILSIENAGDELQNLISTHFRKKLRYYRRALERIAPVTTERASAESLDTMLDALYALHAARWERRGLPGVLHDEVVQRFHRDAARRLLDAGALRMYATRLGERIVAVFYGFAHAGTVYYYLSGYDPELERLSIGTLIVAHAIEEAVRDGAATFDFLRGAEEYKYAWGASDRISSRRQIFRG